MNAGRHCDQPNHKGYPPRRLRRLSLVHPWISEYFLTLCTEGRLQLLATPAVNNRVRQFVAGTLGRYGIGVRCYVLMPDHVHVIVVVGHDGISLGEWVKAFKAYVAKREFVWQKGFFDHALRSEESACEKWDYIRNNPVRAGLVRTPEEWSFGGYYDRFDGAPL